jgi:hypothetical protein
VGSRVGWFIKYSKRDLGGLQVSKCKSQSQCSPSTRAPNPLRAPLRHGRFCLELSFVNLCSAHKRDKNSKNSVIGDAKLKEMRRFGGLTPI